MTTPSSEQIIRSSRHRSIHPARSVPQYKVRHLFTRLLYSTVLTRHIRAAEPPFLYWYDTDGPFASIVFVCPCSNLILLRPSDLASLRVRVRVRGNHLRLGRSLRRRHGVDTRCATSTVVCRCSPPAHALAVKHTCVGEDRESGRGRDDLIIPGPTILILRT